MIRARTSKSPRGSGPFDCQVYFDIAARRVRIGANLLMRLVGERLQFGGRQAVVDDVEFYGEAEAAGFARADRNRAIRRRLAGVLLVGLCDVIERAAETGR